MTTVELEQIAAAAGDPCPVCTRPVLPGAEMCGRCAEVLDL